VKYFLRILVIGIVGLAISCDSSDDHQPDTGKGYFPLRKGLFQIYNVERTAYTLGVPTTTSYQLKTIVVDSFPNANDAYTYVIHRSSRGDDASPWSYIDTWSVRDASAETVVSIGNLSVVSLKYPVSSGLTWNANVYNTLDEDEFAIADLKDDMTLGGTDFSDCLTVTQSNNEDFIVALDQRKEIYAMGVGLVYKDSTMLYYCTQPDCVGQEVVEDGIIYKQTIKSYGVE
jgi:hypothetical protein